MDGLRRTDWADRALIFLVGLFALLGVGGVSALIYVALHFLAKVW